MFRDLGDIYKYRELLWNLVIRDIKTRYKNSVLGFFWSLLNPLIQVAIMTLIFKYVIRFGGGSYSAYLLCAFIPWMFFNMTVLDSCTCIIFQGNLIKKNYFPRELIPISIVISNLLHLLLAFGVFIVYLLVKVRAPILETWLLLPVVIFIHAMFVMGISFFVAALNVFYEDVKYLTAALMNLLMYTMPIIYFLETVYYSDSITPRLKSAIMLFYNLNPLSFLITAYKKIMLEPYGNLKGPDLPVDYNYLLLAAGTSFVVMILGYLFFNSKKWQFAERF